MVLLLANVNVDDPRLSSTQPSAKSPETLFRDLVERSSAISRLVFYLDTQPSGTGAGVSQLQLQFTDAADLVAARAGMPLDWLDCSTRFIDLTPATSVGGTGVATVYLRLVVAQPGSIAGGMPTGHPLLI